jgi:hypothetical protein
MQQRFSLLVELAAVDRLTCTWRVGEAKVDLDKLKTAEDVIFFVDAIRSAEKQGGAGWKD